MTVLSGTEVHHHACGWSYPAAVRCEPTTGYIYVANNTTTDVTILSGTEVVVTLTVGNLLLRLT